jgi:transposase
MIGLTNHQRYFLYEDVCDMRKGFDGLSGIVIAQMHRSPLDGSVYIFINRRRDRMKMLVWESGGYMLYYKRLERGTFELPKSSTTGQISISWETLVLMLTGISLVQNGRKKRYKQARVIA